MPNLLQSKTIAFLAADGVEKVELDKPRSVLQQEGAQVEVVSLKPGEIQARDHDLDPAGRIAVDRVVSDASVDDLCTGAARRHGEPRQTASGRFGSLVRP
jgi:protease I